MGEGSWGRERIGGGAKIMKKSLKHPKIFFLKLIYIDPKCLQSSYFYVLRCFSDVFHARHPSVGLRAEGKGRWEDGVGVVPKL